MVIYPRIRLLFHLSYYSFALSYMYVSIKTWQCRSLWEVVGLCEKQRPLSDQSEHKICYKYILIGGRDIHCNMIYTLRAEFLRLSKPCSDWHWVIQLTCTMGCEPKHLWLINYRLAIRGSSIYLATVKRNNRSSWCPTSTAIAANTIRPTILWVRVIHFLNSSSK